MAPHFFSQQPGGSANSPMAVSRRGVASCMSRFTIAALRTIDHAHVRSRTTERGEGNPPGPPTRVTSIASPKIIGTRIHHARAKLIKPTNSPYGRISPLT